MANSIRGKIVAIEPIQNITSKKTGNTYETRRLLLDATRFDPLTGEPGAENPIMFEFGGKDVHVPDTFKRGDVVEVYFYLRGVKVQKQGEPKPAFFVHVSGHKIEYVNNNQQQAAPQGNAPTNQAQAPTNGAAPQGLQAPQNNGAAQGQQNGGGGQGNDLPF